MGIDVRKKININQIIYIISVVNQLHSNSNQMEK